MHVYETTRKPPEKFGNTFIQVSQALTLLVFEAKVRFEMKR